MEITVSGKNYTLEYTFEAAMNKPCVDNTYAIMTNAIAATDDNVGERESIKQMISGISNIPSMVIENFYAGLIEHHGEDGDGSVLSVTDARKLIKAFFKENPEDEKSNFYGMQSAIMEQMEKDGFFKQIGLEQMAENMTEKPKKTPTDHKRKAPTKAQQKAKENLSVVE